MKQRNHYFKLTLAVLIVIVSLLAVPIGSFMGLELPKWSELFAMRVSAADIFTEGYYTYIISDEKATITDCNTSISGGVVIPDKIGDYLVTSIGDSAFYHCAGLTSVTIPDSVINIGNEAFRECAGLTSVTIGNSVTSIGYSAFENCTGLTKINWNAENVSGFGYSGVFYNAGTSGDGIDVVFGNNVKRIPSYAFFVSNRSYSPKIKSVTIGNSVTSIGYDAFGNCTGLTSITIPDSVTSIGSSAFYYCIGLTSITIPDSITSIGNHAFYNCTGLTSVTIGNSVTNIGNYAFYNCTGLTNVTIGNSVTSIGDYAFYNCSGLTKINWNAESVSDFDYDAKVFYNAGTFGDGIDVVFGDSVNRIPVYAFYVDYSSYRPNIKSVTIGNSVTSIGDYAFEDCTGLTSVTIGNSVTSIGDYAFEDCIGLTNVTIGNSVTSIGSAAFEDCTGLTIITIPESVTSIGDYAFYNCTGLTKINWNAKSVSDFDADDNVFRNAGTSGDGTDLVFGYNVKSIPAYAFFVSNRSYSPKIKSVIIDNSVTSIGDYAFYNCTGLTRVTISNSVTNIGKDTFRGCTGLKSVHITDLAAWCKISFGSYNANPVCYSKKLYINGILATNITIPESVTSIGGYAFYNCTGLTNITIPESVTSIGDDAFSGCTGLTSIAIPGSVTNIGDYIFKECSALVKVKFTGKPPEFSNKTFYGYNKTVLYPYGISEWKSAIKSNYGGYFTWTCYSTGSLTDLQVNTLPKKTVYNQDEKANYSGLKLTATWSDGFSTVITPDSKMYNISFFGFSTETPGIKTVTATLDGKSAQFKIGVHKTTTFTEDQIKYPESAHNYADNLNQTKTYQCPDAIKLIVTFSDKTFVEKDGDYIYVNGTKHTGDQLAGKTITVSGNTLTVKLVSDSYGNYYGYSIDKIEVTKIEHTNKTTTTKATTSADGKIVTACTICGKISKTVVIPKIASISLSAKSYTYDGKVKTPTVTVKNSKGTTLKNGTDYIVTYASGRKTPGQYAVKIIFNGNYSGSKTLYFTILPGVTSKIATATNSSAIKLAWKAVPGATGYRVYQYDTKTKKYVTLKTTTGTSYTVTKLKSGTNYKFAVRAYTIVNGKVFWASGYKTVTATTNPGTPTLKVTAGTKKAALSWNKQTGATGYVVYMATSKNGKYSRIATLKGNSSVTYTKTGLTKGRTYYFKVAAYTVANGKTLYSSFSSVKAVKIK